MGSDIGIVEQTEIRFNVYLAFEIAASRPK